MIARNYIRLNFVGDVYSIHRLNYLTLKISKKDVDNSQLDEMHFICSQSGKLYGILSEYRERNYIFAEKVSFHFIYCMLQSRKLFKYHQKNIRKVELLFPADDFKIFFIYSNASKEYILSAFIHADNESEAKEKFKNHMQELKELHPRKYKDLQCKFNVVQAI